MRSKEPQKAEAKVKPKKAETKAKPRKAEAEEKPQIKETEPAKETEGAAEQVTSLDEAQVCFT